MARKSQKPSEPSLLSQLAKPLHDFVEDIRVHGPDELRKVHENEGPARYLEFATKLLPLIAALNPQGGSEFSDCQTQQDIGRKLLESVGFNDPEDASIEDAVKANYGVIQRLKSIYLARMQ